MITEDGYIDIEPTVRPIMGLVVSGRRLMVREAGDLVGLDCPLSEQLMTVDETRHLADCLNAIADRIEVRKSLQPECSS